MKSLKSFDITNADIDRFYIYINMTENSTHLNEPYQSTIVTVIGYYFF